MKQEQERCSPYVLGAAATIGMACIWFVVFMIGVVENDTRNRIFEQCMKEGEYTITNGDQVVHRLKCDVDVWDEKPIRNQ